MSNVEAPVPHRPGQMAPEWLTTALNATAPVVSTTLEPVGNGRGFVGSVFRCNLRYSEPGSGPASVIIKMPVADERRREVFTRFGLYQREVGFYSDLQADTPVATPRCHFAAIDSATGDFVLLLEDMGEVASGNPLLGATMDQCRHAFDVISRMHCRWWDDPRLCDFEWMVGANAPRIKAIISTEYDAAWREFELQFGRHLPAPLLKLGRGLGPRLGRVLDHLSAPPVTLVHGDFQPANIFYTAGGRIAAVGDWQVIVRARGAMDVAYFMVNGVNPQDRATIERDLLRDYHVELLAGGIQGYSLNELWADYRLAVLSQFGLVIVLSHVLGGETQGTDDPDAAALAGVTGGRLIAAMTDLRPWELLETGPPWSRLARFVRRSRTPRLTGS